MAVVLTDAASRKKAPTGPNPQSRSGQTVKNTTGYPATAPGGAVAGGNPSVTAPGLQPAGAVAVGGQVAAGAATAQTAAQAVQQPLYDYNTDPVLVQIMGQQQLAISQAADARANQIASAQAQALAQQKAALIAYGDPNLAMAVLGDKNTADAAANNPGSTLATMAGTNQQNVRGINDTENKANLFYSSDAGYQLGLNQKAYMANQANAAGNVQGTLGGIGSSLLASEQSAYQTELDARNAAYSAEAQAQSDAYTRALQNPLLGSTAGTTSDTTATGGPTAAGTHPAGQVGAQASPLITQMAAAVNKGGITSQPQGKYGNVLAAAAGLSKPSSAPKVNYQALKNAKAG